MEREQSRPEMGKTQNMLGTIIVNSITFFRSEAKAIEIAEANGGKAEGFIVDAAKGREGFFTIEVVDTDDGLHLGYL